MHLNAFSSLAHLRTCVNVWLTRVRWPVCEHADNQRKCDGASKNST